jgi:hypothetical protein
MLNSLVLFPGLQFLFLTAGGSVVFSEPIFVLDDFLLFVKIKLVFSHRHHTHPFTNFTLILFLLQLIGAISS